MAVYNLPRLRGEYQLDATQSGRWMAPPAGLTGLAGDLAIERMQLRPDELKSIPDAWAQAQLSVQAFFQPGHEASEAVRDQWRGLLATIALQPLHSDSYSLSVDAFDLPGEQTSAPRFQRTLRALLPASLRPQDPEHSASLGIIQLVPRDADPVPIAMLSPDMLVAPGRRAGGVQTAMPWIRKGIRSPLDVASEIRPEAWDILTKYLDQLAGTIAGSGEQITLRQEVEKFAGLCRAKVSTTNSVAKPVKGFAGAYKRLGETFTMVRRDGESGCLLRMSARAGEPLKGIILVDPALTETLGQPANAIRVWGPCSLADTKDNKTYARIKDEAAVQGYLVVRPEDLFTSTLIRLQGDVTIAGHPKALQDALIPISPLALLVAEGSTIEATQSGNKLEVALEVFTADGTSHTVRKEFDRASMAERRAPDDLALWPNFSAPNWPWNFIRYQYTKNKDELRTRFGFSVELLSTDIETGASPQEKVQRASSWASSTPEEVDERILRGDFGTIRNSSNQPLFQRVRFSGAVGGRDSEEARGTVGEQQCLTHGVDAIFFSLPKGKSTEPAGCILPQFIERGSQNDSATVSIDFGTSNTIAYFARKDQPSQRVRFENRVLFPITMPRKIEEIAATYADFFPLWAYETPMPTVLKKREYRLQSSGALGTLRADPEKAEKSGEILGLSYLVFFTPKLERDLSNVLIEFINKGVLRFEIKWDKDAGAKATVKFYLRQLMIMIAAELVAQGGDVSRLAWRLSYPRAFTLSQERSFASIAAQLSAELFKAAGGDGDGPEAMLRTEGEAAAAYFMHDSEQARRGLSPIVLMLDIGGGSTDIAIRYDQALVWQGSAKLAASDFFRNYLAANPKLLEDIDADAVRSFDGGRGDVGERGLRILQLVDLLVAKPEFATAFANAYALHAEDPSWKGLENSATAALGGLMHYCGLVLSRLGADGKIPLEQLDMLTVFLGGRGSTYFRRLASSGAESLLAQICSLALEDQAGAQLDPRFSDLPKQEVARGLLILNPAPAGAQSPAETLPLGLGVQLKQDGGNRMIDADASVESLPAGGSVVNLDMTEFATFLARLKERTGLAIDASSPQAKAAIDMVARSGLAVAVREIKQDEDVDKALASLEPPFITALRGLVGLMAADPERRQALGIRAK